MRLKDKVAFITGANSGIGKAMAERFAAEAEELANLPTQSNCNIPPGRILATKVMQLPSQLI